MRFGAGGLTLTLDSSKPGSLTAAFSKSLIFSGPHVLYLTDINKVYPTIKSKVSVICMSIFIAVLFIII